MCIFILDFTNAFLSKSKRQKVTHLQSSLRHGFFLGLFVLLRRDIVGDPHL